MCQAFFCFIKSLVVDRLKPDDNHEYFQNIPDNCFNVLTPNEPKEFFTYDSCSGNYYKLKVTGIGNFYLFVCVVQYFYLAALI